MLVAVVEVDSTEDVPIPQRHLSLKLWLRWFLGSFLLVMLVICFHGTVLISTILLKRLVSIDAIVAIDSVGVCFSHW